MLYPLTFCGASSGSVKQICILSYCHGSPGFHFSGVWFLDFDSLTIKLIITNYLTYPLTKVISS